MPEYRIIYGAGDYLRGERITAKPPRNPVLIADYDRYPECQKCGTREFDLYWDDRTGRVYCTACFPSVTPDVDKSLYVPVHPSMIEAE